MPFGFWSAANVDPRERVDYADIEKKKKKNHYFHSSHIVLLRETHLNCVSMYRSHHIPLYLQYISIIYASMDLWI